MASAKNVLGALLGSSNTITLAIELAGDIVPIAKATVQEIKVLATGGETVDYQILLHTDGAALDSVDKMSQDDLSAINAELKKLGLPQVPTSASGPAADPAPGTS